MNKALKTVIILLSAALAALFVCVAIVAALSRKPSQTDDPAGTTTGAPGTEPDVTTAAQGLPKPADPSEADEYYWSNSVVLEVIGAKESSDVLSEKEAVALFTERGFDQYPVTWEYSMDGEYEKSTEASGRSETKHPGYQTAYQTVKGDIWIIHIINGQIIAYPVSYNLDSDPDAEFIVAESGTLTSYDDITNKFYVTIPYGSAATVKTVAKIEPVTLENFVFEEGE